MEFANRAQKVCYSAIIISGECNRLRKKVSARSELHKEDIWCWVCCPIQFAIGGKSAHTT
jgi:hypothetical protein